MNFKRWGIARCAVQLLMIALLASPLAGLAIFTGNLAAAELLGLPLADPLAFLQALLGGRVFVLSYLLSALLVVGFYFLLGGRTFCGWVCPVGLVTELADRLRRKLGTGTQTLPLTLNRWSLALVLLVVMATGVPLFELLSPIGIISRAIVFAALLPLLLVAAILLMELLVARRVWCRSLCPLGGFYSLLAAFSPLRIGFVADRCTHCNDCLKACPVEEVLQPSLELNHPQVVAGDCTRCMACLDACPAKALKISIGYQPVSRDVTDPLKGGR
ncbi:quinol dehydrogenase ferredoxin subunit NapH [Trichlorobacter lovleyi]|uniref:Ferredoxin-type protein, NapH/MauN family n=1 Tax=Trichlorobacter lovleyi (strain ATCC BAA-1151 / DSM 17278 / SZ) TaxID=398767 RepID=B3E657_TRIL1|nr:quinol dehydrogenase ferredoxin subunit NapH [Trichlorobacter lovleyi]ACD94781.1 ferredoxin-type protein, NapH/MauN family [Trichlorobacter lovleyi SZ]